MTVKELAVICDVHYNTMRKWLSDNNIKKTNNTRNSRFLITEDVIKSAKQHFLKEDKIKQEETKTVDQILIQQITQKDIQIVKQQDQINHLQKLLENQQILTLKAQERVELLEYEYSSKDSRKSFWKGIIKKREGK